MSEEGERERWSEASTAVYRDLAAVAVPRRVEIIATLLSLMPVPGDDPFTVVELGPGEGFLSEAVLVAYPKAQVVALDGSEEMRMATSARLERFGERSRVDDFDLLGDDWFPVLDRARVVVASLVLHHLDDRGKRSLFFETAGRIDAGGALLIADLVEPQNAPARQVFAGQYDHHVKASSRELAGDDSLWDRFDSADWNHFRTPDVAVDKPSVLAEQLVWLSEAGFAVADCFWMFSGHAVYGAYRAGPQGRGVNYEEALGVAGTVLGA